MKKIKVADIISNAFSSEQALRLKEEMERYMNDEEKIILDFSGIDKYTTLFFNFSTGYFIGKIGKEKYDRLVELDNLSNLGQSTYQNSYFNATRDDFENATIENEIINILKNPDEV